MPQALYHAYSNQFTLASSSTTLPAFFVGNTDTNHALELVKFRIGMAGTGSASVTFQVFASNAGATGLGTSTAGTITQSAGRIYAAGGISVCGYNYTAARTTETYIIIDEQTIVNNQTYTYDYDFGREPDCPLGVATDASGFGIFFSAGTPVASTVNMWVARI